MSRNNRNPNENQEDVLLVYDSLSLLGKETNASTVVQRQRQNYGEFKYNMVVH